MCLIGYKKSCLQLLVLGVSIHLAPQFFAQTQEMPITYKIAKAIQKQEPAWRYVAFVCDCPPLMPGQITDYGGNLERKLNGGKRETVKIESYEIASVEEAASGMKSFINGIMRLKCQVDNYSLGDEAYILHCPDGTRAGAKQQSTIYCRKGNLILTISGLSQETVERFAKYALALLPAS